MAASVLPRVAAYLDQLPGGIDAFPEAEVKYSVVATWLEGHDATALVSSLPDAVHPLLQREFPVTRWVPEVHATMVYLGLRERFFESDDAFVADALERNRTLVNKPMYRILLGLLSKSRAVKGASVTYSQLHRGTELIVVGGDDHWEVYIVHPPHLVPPILGRCYATAMRAALEVKGYENVYCKPIAFEPERTHLQVRFE
ncbi:MAG: hypothetical protein ACRBN8_12680 [Nannocystales bacterium]